jgi:hypothetical protein
MRSAVIAGYLRLFAALSGKFKICSNFRRQYNDPKGGSARGTGGHMQLKTMSTCTHTLNLAIERSAVPGRPAAEFVSPRERRN